MSGQVPLDTVVGHRPTVFLPEPIGDDGLRSLEAVCRLVAPWREGDSSPQEVWESANGEIEAVIVRLFEVRAPQIAQAPKLRVIAKHGVGVDNIDLDAAAARGIPVLATPGVNSNTVAEHTLGLLFTLARRLDIADGATRRGEFYPRERFIGVELSGKTLGVVGIGRIGSRVARKAAEGLGMRVLAYDPPVARADSYRGPARLVGDLDILLAEADFLTLHVPLTSETRGMIDSGALGRMKHGARLINTSRGAVVDENALVQTLSEGRLAAAALDVFSTEPLPVDHPLCRTPNVFLTPHIAGLSPEALAAASREAARGVLEVLAGRIPADLLVS